LVQFDKSTACLRYKLKEAFLECLKSSILDETISKLNGYYGGRFKKLFFRITQYNVDIHNTHAHSLSHPILWTKLNAQHMYAMINLFIHIRGKLISC
jgi:hypothetical protein